MQPDLVAEFAEAYQQEVNQQRTAAPGGRLSSWTASQ
jgi:hypothetical protein